jgi:dTDP-4-amino-4,6-dideoxygalactose transaminase
LTRGLTPQRQQPRPRSVAAARPIIGPAERQAVLRVLDSGSLSQGCEVAAFESEFSRLVSGRPCVAVNSGTSALLLGLLAAGIGVGDEVIVPSFTFAATANAVALAGARPVFVDIEPRFFGIDPEAVAAAITPQTAAILPVHLYGHPAAMDEICALATRHHLAVIEDAAQAHLASLAGQPVGTFGQVAAFSFYPTKNMTTAEGGLVVCGDEAVARRVRLLRNQGMERRYANEMIGFNARMSDLHAALGRAQLSRLPEWTTVRGDNAGWLSTRLAQVPGVTVPPVAPGAGHVWHQYTIRVAERDRVAAALAAAGIGTGVYYPIPVHRLPAYDLRLDLPATERACAEVLSLPVRPGVSHEDLDAIVGATRQAVSP